MYLAHHLHAISQLLQEYWFFILFSSDVNKNNEDEHQKALFNGMVKLVKIEGLFVRTSCRL